MAPNVLKLFSKFGKLVSSWKPQDILRWDGMILIPCPAVSPTREHFNQQQIPMPWLQMCFTNFRVISEPAMFHPGLSGRKLWFQRSQLYGTFILGRRLSLMGIFCVFIWAYWAFASLGTGLIPSAILTWMPQSCSFQESVLASGDFWDGLVLTKHSSPYTSIKSDHSKLTPNLRTMMSSGPLTCWYPFTFDNLLCVCTLGTSTFSDCGNKGENAIWLEVKLCHSPYMNDPMASWVGSVVVANWSFLLVRTYGAPNSLVNQLLLRVSTWDGFQKYSKPTILSLTQTSVPMAQELRGWKWIYHDLGWSITNELTETMTSVITIVFFLATRLLSLRPFCTYFIASIL